MHIKHTKNEPSLIQDLIRASFTPKIMLHEAYEKRGALSMPRTFALLLLYHDGEKSMKELVRHSQMVLPVVSAMINDLEKDNLVKRERSKKDRRVVTVHITNKGKKVLFKQLELIAEIMETIFDRLTKKEQKMFVHLTKKMYRGLYF